MENSFSNPTVFIVHHVDTEGPLADPISETFTKLEEIIGKKIPLKPTKENLVKLQQNTTNFFEKEDFKKIKLLISPHLLGYKTSWGEVDEMLFRILQDDYRQKFKDSYEGNWVFNWHIMDHAGFESNPRHRDLGYLNIFDHYIDILDQTDSTDKDEIHWHFHAIHPKKQANLSATSYENSYEVLHQILCRRIIDRNWFPMVNRAGLHTERPDSNWFLEQWIPFDASNQSLESNDDYYVNGRFGDWKGAPSDWSIYQPDVYDWRKKGNCNRYISRTLNLKTRFRNITIEEIRRAFVKARAEQSHVYLGITNHDFREMSVEMEEFYQMLLLVSKEFSDVKFCFSKALKAFQTVLNLDTTKENRILFESNVKGNLVTIKVKNGEPFGPQPYLAIKIVNGDYIHDNLDFGEFKKEYYYTLDVHTVPLEVVQEMKIACNDKYGNQCILKII